MNRSSPPPGLKQTSLTSGRATTHLSRTVLRSVRGVRLALEALAHSLPASGRSRHSYFFHVSKDMNFGILSAPAEPQAYGDVPRHWCTNRRSVQLTADPNHDHTTRTDDGAPSPIIRLSCPSSQPDPAQGPIGRTPSTPAPLTPLPHDPGHLAATSCFDQALVPDQVPHGARTPAYGMTLNRPSTRRPARATSARNNPSCSPANGPRAVTLSNNPRPERSLRRFPVRSRTKNARRPARQRGAEERQAEP